MLWNLSEILAGNTFFAVLLADRGAILILPMTQLRLIFTRSMPTTTSLVQFRLFKTTLSPSGQDVTPCYTLLLSLPSSFAKLRLTPRSRRYMPYNLLIRQEFNSIFVSHYRHSSMPHIVPANNGLFLLSLQRHNRSNQAMAKLNSLLMPSPFTLMWLVNALLYLKLPTHFIRKRDSLRFLLSPSGNTALPCIPHPFSS
jgi:hypothetical protein